MKKDVENLARDIGRISPETITELTTYVEERIQNIIQRYETKTLNRNYQLLGR